MAKIEDIKKKVLELRNVLDQIKDKRLYWEADTRPRIVNLIKHINTTTGLRCAVQEIDEGIKNAELVRLVIPQQPSGVWGMVNIEGSEVPASKQLVKEQSSISFSQLYNGDIAIFFTMPHIKKYVEELPPRYLGRFEPAMFTDEFIIGKVNEFLDQLLIWESGKDTM